MRHSLYKQVFWMLCILLLPPGFVIAGVIVGLWDGYAGIATFHKTVLISAGIFFCVGTFVALRVAYSLLEVVRQLTLGEDVLHRVANGELNARVVGIDLEGQVGMLLRNINRVLDLTEAFCKESYAAIDSANQRRYYRRIITTGLRGEFVHFAEAVNNSLTLMKERDREFIAFANQHVKSVATAVSEASKDLEMSSAAVSTQANDTTRKAAAVAAAAEHASVNVQAVAVAIKEFAASAEDIRQQIGRSADVTAAVANTASTVRGLGEAAAKIGTIVGLISEIAGQTNLLSLNASIEAARAGEAGRGFAIVAGEIKHLATQTATATSDIASQVQHIQAVAEDAVTAIRDISRAVQIIEESSALVVSSIDQQNTATNEIARNITEAASSASAVSAEILAVQEIAQKTTASIRGMTQSVSELAEQSGTLSGQVEVFIQQIASPG